MAEIAVAPELTTLDELKGHEEPRGPARPRGVAHGAEPDRESWLERRRREAEELGVSTQPYVVIIGGGQGGIGLGARLRQLGVPTVIVDRHPRPGDQWRSRYKSLCLLDRNLAFQTSLHRQRPLHPGGAMTVDRAVQDVGAGRQVRGDRGGTARGSSRLWRSSRCGAARSC
jgi:FAD binding domain-containing protein